MTLNDIAGKKLVTRRGTETVSKAVIVNQSKWFPVDFDKMWYLVLNTHQTASRFYIQMAPYTVYICLEQSA